MVIAFEWGSVVSAIAKVKDSDYFIVCADRTKHLVVLQPSQSISIASPEISTFPYRSENGMPHMNSVQLSGGSDILPNIQFTKEGQKYSADLLMNSETVEDVFKNRLSDIELFARRTASEVEVSEDHESFLNLENGRWEIFQQLATNNTFQKLRMDDAGSMSADGKLNLVLGTALYAWKPHHSDILMKIGEG